MNTTRPEQRTRMSAPRIGSVGSQILPSETEAEGLEHASRVPTGRVTEVAAGRTPGADLGPLRRQNAKTPPVTCVSAVHRGCLSWSLGESNP